LKNQQALAFSEEQRSSEKACCWMNGKVLGGGDGSLPFFNMAGGDKGCFLTF
jgi:hypothetical protein